MRFYWYQNKIRRPERLDRPEGMTYPERCLDALLSSLVSNPEFELALKLLTSDSGPPASGPESVISGGCMIFSCQ